MTIDEALSALANVLAALPIDRTISTREIAEAFDAQHGGELRPIVEFCTAVGVRCAKSPGDICVKCVIDGFDRAMQMLVQAQSRQQNAPTSSTVQ